MVVRVLIVFLFTAAIGAAEIIDRIVATVDNQVITQSQLLEDIRLAAMLNGEKPAFDPASRRKAANRLVEQLLMRREMELTQYAFPALSEVDSVLEQIKRTRFSDGQYVSELARYEVTESDLKQYLLRQAATLRFIEARFRPEVQVTESEVKDCYEKRIVSERQNRNSGAELSLEEARSQCEEALTAERVDKALDRWLKETRERTRVVYKEDAFQ